MLFDGLAKLFHWAVGLVGCAKINSVDISDCPKAPTHLNVVRYLALATVFALPLAESLRSAESAQPGIEDVRRTYDSVRTGNSRSGIVGSNNKVGNADQQATIEGLLGRGSERRGDVRGAKAHYELAFEKAQDPALKAHLAAKLVAVAQSTGDSVGAVNYANWAETSPIVHERVLGVYQAIVALALAKNHTQADFQKAQAFDAQLKKDVGFAKPKIYLNKKLNNLDIRKETEGMFQSKSVGVQ